jgi:diadenosine tetraphosphate (Ap4A) HIT family hydrolase
MAKVHPQLLRDCFRLGRFPLCHLLLMRDANYPWFIMVPDREDIREIYHLSEADQHQLLRESTILSRALEQAFTPDKLNIAALGNIVPQLHIHHIVRYKTDPAWPATVWGKLRARAYDDQSWAAMIAKIKAALTEEFNFEV